MEFTGQERERERAACASLSEMLHDAGPTHDDLGQVFDIVDLDADLSAGSKRERVYAAVIGTSADKAAGLIGRLLEILWENGSFEPGGDFNGVPRLSSSQRRQFQGRRGTLERRQRGRYPTRSAPNRPTRPSNGRAPGSSHADSDARRPGRRRSRRG